MNYAPRSSYFVWLICTECGKVFDYNHAISGFRSTRHHTVVEVTKDEAAIFYAVYSVIQAIAAAKE